MIMDRIIPHAVSLGNDRCANVRYKVLQLVAVLSSAFFSMPSGLLAAAFAIAAINRAAA